MIDIKRIKPQDFESLSKYLESKEFKLLHLVVELLCEEIDNPIETLPDRSKNGLIDFLIGGVAMGYLQSDKLMGFIERIESQGTH